MCTVLHVILRGAWTVVFGNTEPDMPNLWDTSWRLWLFCGSVLSIIIGEDKERSHLSSRPQRVLGEIKIATAS